MTLQNQRKIKGNNFSEQIENGQKFKKFIEACFNSQDKENIYPMNLIREIAFTPLQLVSADGKTYVKNYSYKGTFTHFEFLNNPNFSAALEYVDRPKIKKVKVL